MDGKKLEYKGDEALKEIERMTMNGSEIQESLLKQILTQNIETEYLNKYIKKGDLVTTDIIAEFKRRVPVTSYEDILPYMQRIANGEDSSLITAQLITEILCSSGTSGGKPKMLPSIAEDFDRRTFFYNLLMPIMNKYVPGLDEGKGMYLNFPRSDISTTPCGLPIRTVISSYFKSKHFKSRQREPWNDLTSPDQTILCDDINQSMHCQLLAGLVYRHKVLRIGTTSYVSVFLKAISFLEHNWKSLSQDIRSGKLSSFITDPGCRSSMSTVLSSPDPHLADEIIQICSQKSWKGILCQLWPKAKYIETIITGSMAQYVPALQHYNDGKLPLVCLKYCASESYFGINIKPLSEPADIAYTLVPNMSYFEFLPLGDNGTPFMETEQEQVPNDKLVDLGNVKLGCFYEILVTTFAGLYRYRVGDALQVVGFYNKAPQFRFVGKQNVVISIDSDKTSEEDLHKSVNVAKKLLEPHDILLVDYTSYPGTCLAPGHYILYWEIQHQNSKTESAGASLDISVLQECCIAVEEQLDYVYCHLRNDGSIGPLEIRVVEAGTFDALLELSISLGASISQYKTPRGIKSDKALNLVNSKVTASFFSPRNPKWGSKKVS